MSINAIVPYAGGKRTIAKEIVKQLGKHKTYWNPCCGSMAELFVKEKSKIEVVNDLHGHIINLAKVIQSDILGAMLYEKLLKTLFCEEIFYSSQDILKESTIDNLGSLSAAYHYFLISWMGANGFAGTEKEFDSWFCIRYKSGGGDPLIRFKGAIDQIPAWHERLRNVTIISKDMFDILEKIDDKEDVALYIDPPYLKKNFKYKFDFEPESHVKMAQIVNRFTKTRVVISYYDDPLLLSLYPSSKWNKKEIKVTKQMCHLEKEKATEILLVNGSVYE